MNPLIYILLLAGLTTIAESANPVLMHAPFFSYEVDTGQFQAREITPEAHRYTILPTKNSGAGSLSLSCLWLEPDTAPQAWAEDRLAASKSVEGVVTREYRFAPCEYSDLRSAGIKLTIQTRQWNELERVEALVWHPDAQVVISVSAEAESVSLIGIESLCDSILLQRIWLQRSEALLLAEALNQTSQAELERRSLQLADTHSDFRKALSFVAWPFVVAFRCAVALGLLISLTLAFVSIVSLPGALLAGQSLQLRLCALPLCLVMIWLGNLCDVPGGTGGEVTDDWTAYAVGQSGKHYYWDSGGYSRAGFYDDDLPSLIAACNNFAYQAQAQAHLTEPVVARVLDIKVGRFHRHKVVLQGPSLLWIDRKKDSRYWEYGIWRDAWCGNYGHTLFRPAFTRAMYTGPDCLPDNIDDFGDPKLSALEN